MITAIKPKACKNCKHWEPRSARCELASSEKVDPIRSQDGVIAEVYGADAFLTTGPDFYCCHFKEKEI